MKKTAFIVTFCLSAAAPLLADGTNMLTDDKSRLSYAIGMTTGHQWKLQDLDFDPDLYARGIKDAMAGGAMLLTPEQAQQTIDAFKIQFTARQQQKQIELAAKNKAEGEAFLAKNKTQPGVVTLPDGLQYKVITEGDGEIPGDNNIVTMNYRGTFVDGTEFDSSARAGKPLQVAVGRLFPGWSEALKLMKTGSKWQLFIPAELAYGQNGKASLIPPNSTLIFEVELLAIERPQSQPAAPANPPLTSDIIWVQGTNLQILKPEDVQKLQQSQPQPGK